jgi:CBS domain-containing protein
MGLDSVYMASLKRRGTSIPEGIEETAMTTTLVQDVMRESSTCVGPRAPFDEIAQTVKGMRTNSVYVVDDEKTLLGVIRLHDIKSFLQQSGLGELVIAADLMGDVPDIHPEYTMAEIVEHFDDPELSDLPVVAPGTRRLLGLVDRRDIVSVLSLEILSAGSRRAKFVEHAGAQHYVEMPEGHKMGRIDAPADMFGRRLRDSDLRGRTGVTVLTIVRATERIEAHPDSVVNEGDALIVMGPVEEIRKLGGDV